MTPKNILIVEDEMLVAIALRDQLESDGKLACTLATTAEDAIAALGERSYALVVLDVRLSGGDTGLVVANEIRSSSDIPILFYTAFAEEVFPGLVTSFANSTLIEKPVDVTRLARIISHLLEANGKVQE